MYIFNRVTVVPKLPDEVAKLAEISNNLWWSWNTEFLKLFQYMDRDLWDSCEKNPIKFLKNISQERIEKISNDQTFLDMYREVVNNYESYMNSKDSWFEKNYKNNQNELFAYFSAEYGLDEIIPIYSGGLGILSGDHLKSASDLGLPFVAVGLLYKNGYFRQRIDSHGQQYCEYHNIDLYNLPINPVKDNLDEDVYITIPLEGKTLYLKIWQINVGRIKLYLMDSDVDKNPEEFRSITLRLYGGDREMRLRQEIVLGMGGVKVLKELGYEPTLYHMNEGHSAFLTLELIKNIMQEKEISFEMAKEFATAKTVFTTHTPVPAGNDIFDVSLIERYFDGMWDKFGITKEEFLKLGMPDESTDQGFNMGVLALKIAGKKNGVSKLHGAVSRELFTDVWPNIADDESPITYVTNGIHTTSWLAPNLKHLFNEYLPPYWQDNIHQQSTWEKIDDIPDEKLWAAHVERKEKLIRLVRENARERFAGTGEVYEQVCEVLNKLDPNALTIGFARRFATYKRATLLFKDISRLTEILCNKERPVQIFFAGKAHPQDRDGQELIKTIHEVSLMPQFRGKIFILENYNIGISRYLVSGVDVWLNNPRRPMEASGTSGEKAAVNGVVNFSVLDGWWCEGYDGQNGWTIGTNATYATYEEQDKADSNSLYDTLENKIIPTYYKKDDRGVPTKWVKFMKNSIKSTGGMYSTARMVVDYVEKLYMPLCNLTREKFNDIESVARFTEWKKNVKKEWKNIRIIQDRNVNDGRFAAGSSTSVYCDVYFGNIDKNHAEVQVYFGQIMEDGTMKKIYTQEMNKIAENPENNSCSYEATIDFSTGGNFGYTFRVVPKNDMMLDPENLDLIKWLTKEDEE